MYRILYFFQYELQEKFTERQTLEIIKMNNLNPKT